jgi:hypothetical protein
MHLHLGDHGSRGGRADVRRECRDEWDEAAGDHDQAGRGDLQLSLSSAGSVVRDAGTVAWSAADERSVTRGGQRVRVWTGSGRFTGRRGELTLRFRWEWLDAGRGYEAGVGTWRVVAGTGSYAALRGNGRSAAVWLPQGPVASRVDGFVREG